MQTSYTSSLLGGFMLIQKA